MAGEELKGRTVQWQGQTDNSEVDSAASASPKAFFFGLIIATFFFVGGCRRNLSNLMKVVWCRFFVAQTFSCFLK